jgi:CheY-like chemotaxis protein
VLNVSLRILFADDSVTAQNMGKKILTEAGYEVVAVSNGAAAVKKIAEQKPDIIILDVYMPGYSGLEVCEKVRGSMETMKTPVLLTVGKLEPYKPEDANRVKADGVIVKPFEASDLLAIVKKFEERISQVPVLVPQPARAERFEETETARQAAESVGPPPAPVTLQPMVEVPDHMATTAAFSDLLGSEPAVSGNHFDAAPRPVVVEAPQPVVVETPPPVVLEIPQQSTVLETPPPVVETPIVAAPARAPIPDFELPVSWREPEPMDAEIPVTAPPEPAPVPSPVELEPEPIPTTPSAVRPLQIPVYQEPDAAEARYELMPTSAPPLGEIELPREPQLDETVAEATRNTVANVTDPALLPSGQQFEPMRMGADEIVAAEMAPLEEEFTPAGFQDIPADIASHLPPPGTLPQAGPANDAAADPVSDSDFEARVAAALAAYSHNHQDAAAAANRPPVPDFFAASEPSRAPNAAGFTQQTDARESPATLERPVKIQEPAPVVGAPRGITTPQSPVMDSASTAIFEYRPVGSERRRSAGVPAEHVPAEPSEADQPDNEISPEAPAAQEPPPYPTSVREPVTADARAALVASIDEALPPIAEAAVAANADSGADHQAISQAVHRVMERLKPELVDQILRELKTKKE